ncbi:pre-mRNA splicing factor, putative [Babesia ovis]|uniref:Pre-mRNA splicing factor, putative n=1 Tax=Babesia ovis TaxID=5869 RepID=A0A9W5WUG7_BABOV|nr:pre-mRNA splicing factor, putative [Babesia ovis]
MAEGAEDSLIRDNNRQWTLCNRVEAEGLEWLYADPTASKNSANQLEEYLLGKSIEGARGELGREPIDQTAAGSLLADNAGGNAVDQALSKFREDPLFVIKKVELHQKQVMKKYESLARGSRTGGSGMNNDEGVRSRRGTSSMQNDIEVVIDTDHGVGEDTTGDILLEGVYLVVTVGVVVLEDTTGDILLDGVYLGGVHAIEIQGTERVAADTPGTIVAAIGDIPQQRVLPVKIATAVIVAAVCHGEVELGLETIRGYAVDHPVGVKIVQVDLDYNHTKKNDSEPRPQEDSEKKKMGPQVPRRCDPLKYAFGVTEDIMPPQAIQERAELRRQEQEARKRLKQDLYAASDPNDRLEEMQSHGASHLKERLQQMEAHERSLLSEQQEQNTTGDYIATVKQHAFESAKMSERIRQRATRELLED